MQTSAVFNLTPGTYDFYFWANNSLGLEYTSENISLIVIGNLSSNQQLLNASGSYNVTENDTELLLVNGANVDILIPTNVSSTHNVELNLSGLMVGNQVELGGSNPIEVTREGSVNLTVEISTGTTITGSGNWDGNFVAPIINTGSFAVTNGNVDLAMDFGDNDRLNFSNAIKVTLSGMAGKRAAWAQASSALTPITTICNNATNPTNVPIGGECYVDSGSDLVIWTYHATTYSAYTYVAPSSGSSGSGGHHSYNSNTYNAGELSSEDYIAKLSKDDKILFTLDGESHSLTLDKINSNAKTVEVTLMSNPVVLTLENGVSQKVDLDADGVDDINVKYVYVSSYSANVVISKVEITPIVEEKDSKKPIEENVVKEIPSNDDEVQDDSSVTKDVVDKTTEVVNNVANEVVDVANGDTENKTYVWIIVGLLLIAAIGAGIYFFMK